MSELARTHESSRQSHPHSRALRLRAETLESIWKSRQREYLRVVQRDWETPKCSDWVEGIEKTVAAAADNAVLVAHSLACTTVAHWAMLHPRPILGALLVAPSDVEAPSYPPGTTGFAPMPLAMMAVSKHRGGE